MASIEIGISSTPRVPSRMAVGKSSLIGIPYAPLGRTMIGGLITSTFLTLFVVPLFYTYFDDLRTFLRVVMARTFSRETMDS